MSQQQPARGRAEHTAEPCEWCIYGAAHWFVCYGWVDDLYEQERFLCDRCVEELKVCEARGDALVFEVEVA